MQCGVKNCSSVKGLFDESFFFTRASHLPTSSNSFPLEKQILPSQLPETKELFLFQGSYSKFPSMLKCDLLTFSTLIESAIHYPNVHF
jgi:hypothetical protein